jgi:hypothetical protein
MSARPLPESGSQPSARRRETALFRQAEEYSLMLPNRNVITAPFTSELHLQECFLGTIRALFGGLSLLADATKGLSLCFNSR